MPGISFTGFNGFDFGAIIDAIIQYESLPLNTLQTQQQAVKDKDSALLQLNGFITRLQTQATSLAADDGAFASVTAVNEHVMPHASQDLRCLQANAIGRTRDEDCFAIHVASTIFTCVFRPYAYSDETSGQCPLDRPSADNTSTWQSSSPSWRKFRG